MVITKDTYIKLVRFDVTKEHQITFLDGVAQVDYFKNQLRGIVLEASSYQRKEFKIRFPALIDDIQQFNYAIVQNKPESYKYYFYYISDMEYISDELTDVTIKLDVFQTFQFDFHYLKSYVEREHTNNDSVGSNTIPEGLETGTFIINSTQRMSSLMNYIYMIQVKRSLDGVVWLSTDLGGIRYSGGFYAVNGYDMVAQIIEWYAENTPQTGITIDDIVSIYMVPSYFLPAPFRPATNSYEIVYSYSSASEIDYSISKPSSIDGYTPKNKKLLTKEFNYLVVSNESGATSELYYENFTTSNCQFLIEGVPVPSASGRISPKAYGNAGSGANYNPYSIPFGKMPIIDSNYDYYKIWLNNNSFNLTTGAIETGLESIAGGLQLGVSAFTGNVEGMISGGTRGLGIYGYAYDMFKKFHEVKRIPPQTISHSANGDVLNALHENIFVFYQFCIKREYAQIIDEFLSKFGYKTLKIKVPNITGRSNWNYVKTIEACVDSESVPKKYIEEFKDMLNRGITFWHNPATFMDYSQSNNIV